MSERTLQQIIESEQEPTEEERAHVDGLLDAWWDRRFQRAKEYARQPRCSGYVLSHILTEHLTLHQIRGQWRVIREYGVDNLITALKALDRFIGDLTGQPVVEPPDPYVYAQPRVAIDLAKSHMMTPEQARALVEAELPEEF